MGSHSSASLKLNENAGSLMSAEDARRMIRSGEYSGGTAELCHGRLQGNLVILESDWAADFARFCLANPEPCPVVGLSEPGDPRIPILGSDLDIRTDIPRYMIYRDGVLVAETGSLEALWTTESVAFILGCSYTFELAMLEAGLPVRHIEEGKTVPMFKSSIETTKSDRFSGPTVVSMRPMLPEQAEKAAQLTQGFAHAHGAPVHIGDGAQIGINDLSKPDWGDAVTMKTGEIPVFWCCGVTPQAAIERARPPLCIAHKPGHMLISDLHSGEEAMSAYQATQEQLERLGSQ